MNNLQNTVNKTLAVSFSSVMILLILVPLSAVSTYASQSTPWQLFQQLCRYVSPSSPQCQLYQQQQQQQFIPTQQQQPFIPTQQQQSTSPPVANAGPNQAVTLSSLVTLDGTASFATNAGATIASYSWVQTSGTTVSLNGANTARPTFTAPTVATSLVFSLTVTDSTGAVSSPATVTITVS